MAKRSLASIWARSLQRTMNTAARAGLRAGARAAKQATRQALKQAKAGPARSVAKPRRKTAAKPAAKPASTVAARTAKAAPGEMIAGLSAAPAGARRYLLFSPPGVRAAERLPLLVMLHGCKQDAAGFAHSTRMNRLAARERFFVLYPEQDRRANPQGCWNWYGTNSGAAQGEAAILAAAVDQVCRLYAVDAERIAVAGLSAGASMAALLATREPQRFCAVVMHSGIPPGTAHSALTALGAMRGRRGTAALPTAAPAGAAALPPLLVIHGSSDGTVVPANGRTAAQVWADALGARAGTPRQVQRGQRRAMGVTDFKRSRRVLVTLCEVARLGHAWSGGDARQPFGDATGPDATRMVWAFARKQFGRT